MAVHPAAGRVVRTVALILLVVALAAGCAALSPRTSVAPAGRQVDPSPSPSPTAAPPALLAPISVPNLPIGGHSTYADRTQSLQCLDLHWAVKDTTSAALRAGVTVRITSFAYDSHVFGLSRRGCESHGPTCVGYTFSAASGRLACSLAVRTRWPLSTTLDDRRLGAGGVLSCPAVLGSTGCRRQAAAIGERWTTVSVSTPHRRTAAR